MTSHTTNSEPNRQPDASWTGRPVLARLLRLSIALAPVVIATVATYLVGSMFDRPSGVGPTVAWFVGLVVFSVLIMALVERLARLLLPLTLLLRLTLVFPDQAPSRFSLALRTSSTKELERTVQLVRERGLGDSDAEAAENLLVLVAALSEHDRLTRGHSERVRAYTELIADEMGLPEADRSKLRWAGLLHDVGKLYVPEEILNKPGRLTGEEFDVVKKHPEWGAQLVRPLAGWLGPWIDAVGQHHERWDGAGYPNGLAGTDISLAARIVSVADVFDVITSSRSYKSASSAVEARAELARHSGTQFDPAVVRAFLNVGIGRVRRTMWPLTLVAQIPQLAPLVIAPAAGPAVSSIVAAGAVFAGTTGAAVFDPPSVDDVPHGLAFTDRAGAAIDLDDPAAVILIDPEGGLAGGAPKTASSKPRDPSGGGSAGTVRPPGATSVPMAEVGGPTTGGLVPTPPVVSLPRTTLPTTSVPTTSVPTTSVPTTSVPTTSVPTTSVPKATLPSTTTSTSQPTTTSTTAPPVCVLAGVVGVSGAGGCQFTDAYFGGADLGGLDLRGIDFSGSDLRGANLAGSDLGGARFVGARLERAGLAGSDLTDADLTDARLERANLAGAVLHNVDLTGARLDWADFSGASGVPSTVAGARFHRTICPPGAASDSSCW